ncbi:MAG TPA: peptide chain release factor N(5)-glutamine methyltransferase [Solirubrobacterales bacterium]|nr:peptide chain release factor N(5)-glutamine methyltransferase [Solirubrobacterales bacterium]
MAIGQAAVGEALGAAVDAFAAAGIEDPRLDAEVLLAEASGCDRAALIADAGAEIEPAAGRTFAEMVRRRLRREPVAYILGRKGFRRIELAVDRRVLIPRPETEMLVELALELRPARVLDLGTGSGAIALAVADELPDAEIVATDTSPAALEVARANAERLGLGGRVRFLEASIPEGEHFDLVLANLPYIAEEDWAALAPELRDWEPESAFRAGPDGLDAIRWLLSEDSVRRLWPETPQVTTGASVLALEIGEGQAPEVERLLRGAGFPGVEIRLDLAGIERIVVGRR